MDKKEVEWLDAIVRALEEAFYLGFRLVYYNICGEEVYNFESVKDLMEWYGETEGEREVVE